MKILLVDDSAFMRMMIKNAIKDLSNEIQEANDGVEAVQIFQSFRPNLTFMDVVMPNKNGIEALREIRQLDANATIIMCTSVGGQESVVTEAVEAGAADFVTKPFKPEDIRNIVLQFDEKMEDANEKSKEALEQAEKIV